MASGLPQPLCTLIERRMDGEDAAVTASGLDAGVGGALLRRGRLPDELRRKPPRPDLGLGGRRRGRKTRSRRRRGLGPADGTRMGAERSTARRMPKARRRRRPRGRLRSAAALASEARRGCRWARRFGAERPLGWTIAGDYALPFHRLVVLTPPLTPFLRLRSGSFEANFRQVLADAVHEQGMPWGELELLRDGKLEAVARQRPPLFGGPRPGHSAMRLAEVVAPEAWRSMVLAG